jgi:hypothetical protein
MERLGESLWHATHGKNIKNPLVNVYFSFFLSKVFA